MIPHLPVPLPAIELPDPDTIRAAIDEADERARLLRRLLRLSTRVHVHVQDAIRYPALAIKTKTTEGTHRG